MIVSTPDYAFSRTSPHLWKHRAPAVVLALLVLVSGVTGCRQRASDNIGSAGIRIHMDVEPLPPVVGRSMLTISLHSEQGAPLENAAVQVRGDMTHAGMNPQFGTVTEADGEIYRVPFEWTMGGDWILTVSVTSSTGETFTDTFEFTVQ